jgi:hypothetical protein
MEQTTKNAHKRAASAARPKAPSFSLIFDEIFTEDMLPQPAFSAQALGSSALNLPANGHGPNIDTAACLKFAGFNDARGGAPFPDKFCIGEDGEDLMHSLGPELAQEEVSFENFSMDNDHGDFIVRLMKFDEQAKAKYGVLETPPPSFDFASITSKLKEHENSWKNLRTKAAQLVATGTKQIGTDSNLEAENNVEKLVGRSHTPPTTNKRNLAATVSENLTMSKQARRNEAAESHRRATAKRSRTQGRFAKRQYVWVSIGTDGRKLDHTD